MVFNPIPPVWDHPLAMPSWSFFEFVMLAIWDIAGNLSFHKPTRALSWTTFPQHLCFMRAHSPKAMCLFRVYLPHHQHHCLRPIIVVLSWQVSKDAPPMFPMFPMSSMFLRETVLLGNGLQQELRVGTKSSYFKHWLIWLLPVQLAQAIWWMSVGALLHIERYFLNNHCFFEILWDFDFFIVSCLSFSMTIYLVGLPNSSQIMERFDWVNWQMRLTWIWNVLPLRKTMPPYVVTLNFECRVVLILRLQDVWMVGFFIVFRIRVQLISCILLGLADVFVCRSAIFLVYPWSLVHARTLWRKLVDHS